MKKTTDKTKINVITKKSRGRPTKYLPIYVEQAKKLAIKGLIDKDIYDVLGISEPIGIKWKKKYPEFDKALKQGKKDYDSEQIESKLKKLANGYKFKSEKIVVISDGNQNGSHWERVPIIERVEPNLGAIKEWLWNRNSQRWKNKVDIEHSGKMEYKVIPDEILEDKE